MFPPLWTTLKDTVSPPFVIRNQDCVPSFCTNQLLGLGVVSSHSNISYGQNHKCGQLLERCTVLLSLNIGNKVTLQNAERIRSKLFSLQIGAKISVVRGRGSSDPNGEPCEGKKDERAKGGLLHSWTSCRWHHPLVVIGDSNCKSPNNSGRCSHATGLP